MAQIVPTLPLLLPVGSGAIRLEQDDPFTLNFLSGLTAEHPIHMASCRDTHLIDTDILLLIVLRRELARLSASFNTGKGKQ